MSVRKNGNVTVASGFDEGAAIVGVLLCVVFGGASLVLMSVERPWAIPVLVFFTVLACGCRYVVRLSPDGIRLTVYRMWFVPAYRRKYLLDADIDLYHTPTGEAPVGLCIRDPYPDAGLEVESECFAKHWNRKRLLALCEELEDALDALRAAVPKNAPELGVVRHPWLGPHGAAFDVARAARDARGRIKTVASRAPIMFGGIVIPPGSMWFFNDERFLDPRRPDRLMKVVLGTETIIAGLTARSGGSLMFDPGGRLSSLRGAFGPEVEVQGTLVDGREIIAFGEDGKLSTFTLARVGRVGGHVIPERSRFMRWPGDKGVPARWTCWLGGPLALPDVELLAGDTIEISIDGKTVTGISPRRNVTVGGVVLRSGIIPIPLGKDDRIDLARCEKIGLVLARGMV
jgi:hypothetical protein